MAAIAPWHLLFLIVPFPVFFSLFSSFQYCLLKQLIVNNIAEDWIWTADVWYRKQLLYQLRHNLYPNHLLFVCLFGLKRLSHFANLFYFAPCHCLINRQQIIRIFGIIKTPLNWCPKMVIIKKSKYLIVSLKFKLKCKPDAKLRWALGELNRSGIILWRPLIREKAPTLRLNFHSNFFIETLPIHFLPNHDSS